MSDLPVPVASPPELPKSETLVCANCGAELAGEYCAACGQRHEPHVHTVGHFVGEALESISHADSRLWRTLWLLFARPGLLTREFFAGHRARYLPPFRLYLVLSVILVLLTTMGGGDETDPDYLVGKSTAPPAAPAPIESDQETEADRYVVNIDGLNDFCDAFNRPDDGSGNFAGRQNVRKFCTRIRTEAGELAEVVVHSIPRAMFVFLPLIAAIMKLMYWRPRRYYVEHLLFLVHNHAAVFLVYTLVALFSFIPVVGDFTPLLFFAALAYLAWYIFRAMRVVYAQGGWLTFSKYFILFWIYVITALLGFLLTMIAVAIWG
jgi:hypothetical protein